MQLADETSMQTQAHHTPICQHEAEVSVKVADLMTGFVSSQASIRHSLTK